MKETFKELLDRWEYAAYTKIVLYAKYIHKIDEGNAKELLDSSFKLFDYDVLYQGLDSNMDLVVVLDFVSYDDKLKLE